MKRVCESCNKRRDTNSYTSDRGKLCTTCRRDRTRAAARARHLSQTYKITVEEYDKIVELQGGTCAICHGARPYNLAVDHDHAIAETFGMRESIRGALCKRCNKLLRDVHDDITILLAAADYVLNPPAKKVLFP